MLNKQPMRTIVTFKSAAFNTTEHKGYFINPDCYGDDLARWLIARLRAIGISTNDEAGQEDFGWYLTFSLSDPDSTEDAAFDFVISYRPDESDADSGWIGFLERKRGLFSSIFGGRERGIFPVAVQVIHSVLADAQEIFDVRWHFKKDFERGREELGMPSPFP